MYIPQSVKIDPSLLICDLEPELKIKAEDTWSEALNKSTKAFAICADKVKRIKHIYELRSEQH